MERSSTIGYILIFFLLLGYWFFNKDTVQQLENQEQISEVIEDTTRSNQEANDIVKSNNNSIYNLTSLNEEINTLKNSVLKVDFSNIGGIPKVVNLLDYKKYDSTDLLLIDSNQLQFEYSLPLSNGRVLNTSELEFKSTQSIDNSITYTYSYEGS